MRVNPKQHLNRGIKFLQRNADVFVAVGLGTVCYIASKKFGIPMDFNMDRIPHPCYRPARPMSRIIFPRNSVEASIFSIAKSAEDMTWDSDKLHAAEDICAIALQNDISEETRSFAIMTLSDLAEDMTWDSDKRRIHKLIMNLTKGTN